MITIPRTPSDFANPTLKVIGVGGAGGNAVDRLVLDGLSGAEIIAINTDLQALAGSVAPRRVQIGQAITRGLGTGGDPEIGRSAAEECSGELQTVVADATVVFVLAGFGGGTGSGALPVIADLAREQNAFVVVLGTLPFSFEGKRRSVQAAEALDAVRGLADLVICFENDKIADIVSAGASVQEAFATADQTLSQCVRAMAALLHRRGLLRVGFDEIGSALRGEARSYFGYGEAAGANRAHDALAAALKCSSYLDHGRALKQADAAVVQVVGGDDFTLNELSIMMEEVNRYVADNARLYFGTATDSKMTGKLSIAIFCGTGREVITLCPAVAATSQPALFAVEESTEAVEPEERASAVPEEIAEYEAVEAEAEEVITAEEEEAGEESAAEPPPFAALEPEEQPIIPAAQAAAARHPIFARLDAARRAEAAAARASASYPAQRAREERQEQMTFEPVNRGRFEKSEPTIIDGEDLDVPTFMRRKVR